MKNLKWVGLIFAKAVMLSMAQDDVIGVQWGNFVIRPEAGAQVSYDDRVTLLPNDKADGEFYTDVEAGIRLENLPARYNLRADALYGYRFYEESTASDGDYYNAGASLATVSNPFKWEVGADVTKTLSYDTDYEPDAGDQLGSVISDTPNRRTEGRAVISYDVPLTERTAIRPQYSFLYYNQEFEGSSNSVDYLTHQAGLQVRRQYSENTTFTAGASYGLQSNDDEDGNVATASIGIENRASEKITWMAEIGYSYGDYEDSGSDHGPVSHLRGSWEITDKVSAYVFGGNEFEPGYDNVAARLTYRLGYGAGWQFAEKMTLQASMLHDYQDEIGGNESNDPVIGEVRNFFNTSVGYAVYRNCAVSLGYRYVADEKKPDQQIVFLRAGLVL